MSKIRLDQLLVQQQLVQSREQAQRLIRAGHVRIKEQTVSKPGHLFPKIAKFNLKRSNAMSAAAASSLKQQSNTFN